MHDCQYAKHIRHEPSWLVDENGNELCAFCHVPKHGPADKQPAAKTVRK